MTDDIDSGPRTPTDAGGSAPESSGPSIREALDWAVANSNVAEGDNVRGATSPAPSRETDAEREVPAEPAGKDSVRAGLENAQAQQAEAQPRSDTSFTGVMRALEGAGGDYVRSIAPGMTPQKLMHELLTSDYNLRSGTAEQQADTILRGVESYKLHGAIKIVAERLGLLPGGQGQRGQSKSNGKSRGNDLRATLRGAYDSLGNGRA